MFNERSRYKNSPVAQAKMADGRTVTYVRVVPRSRPSLIGYHKRDEEQRLDHLANFYLKDPTRFWLLCDANECTSPHALGVRGLIGMPR